MKKCLVIILMMVFILTLRTSVQANDFADINIYQESYKVSENGNVKLPFLLAAQKNLTVDEEVTHSGVLYSTGTLDISSKLDGVHGIFSNDTLTITGEIDNAVIVAGNVVIEGKVSGDIFVSAPGVFIKKDAVISGDIIVYADTLDIEGNINGSILGIVSGKTTIKGNISGDFRLRTEDILFDNGTILGDIVVKTNADTTLLFEKYPNSKIIKISEVKNEKAFNIQEYILDGAVTVVVFTLIMILLLNHKPNALKNLLEKVRKYPKTTIFMGILTPLLVIGIIPVVLILIFLKLGIIGWPVLIGYAAFLAISYLLRILVTAFVLYPVMASWLKVGEFKANKGKSLGIVIVLLVVLYVLSVIPIVSEYTNLAMFILTAGTACTSIKKEKKD